ncbi:hypothetical protein [Yeosuana marina]|uniref:hypothetical protein n=1 Tax=Yeosuana marina TaxID=1565536 RepID=UPI0030C85BC1
METNKNIQDKVNTTFDALDSIQEVNVSPFFKDKTMRVLFSEKKTDKYAWLWAWFTPKLQFATLVCIILINVYTFFKMNKNDYEENVTAFAETYGLKTDNQISMFN